MSNYFEGWYFKHQNKKETVAVIPGISDDCAFIQLITDEGAFRVDYGREQFVKGADVCIADSRFSLDGITLKMDTDGVKAEGEIAYSALTPVRSDAMGFFRFFPMQCRHGVLSLHHRLMGSLTINGRKYDFSDGTGYIEKDSGRSFPRNYVWIQSNDFAEKCAVMVSAAHIPFLGFSFTGLIGMVWYRGKEYRIATYNGGEVLVCNERQIVVANPRYRLEVVIPNHDGHALAAPEKGCMSRIIKESPAVPARFRFYGPDGLIFDSRSGKTSFEFV